MSQTTSNQQLLADVLPFSSLAELRQKVDEMKQSVDSLGTVFQQVKALMYIGGLIGRWKAMTCKSNLNGFCTGWRIPNEIVFDVKKNFGENSIVEKDGTFRFNVTNTALVCAICPLYSPKS